MFLARSHQCRASPNTVRPERMRAYSTQNSRCSGVSTDGAAAVTAGRRGGASTSVSCAGGAISRGATSCFTGSVIGCGSVGLLAWLEPKPKKLITWLGVVVLSACRPRKFTTSRVMSETGWPDAASAGNGAMVSAAKAKFRNRRWGLDKISNPALRFMYVPALSAGGIVGLKLVGIPPVKAARPPQLEQDSRLSQRRISVTP